MNTTPTDNASPLQDQLKLARENAQDLRDRLKRSQVELEQAKQANQERKDGPIKPVASPATLKTRHYGMFIAFLIMVVSPVAISTYYLYAHAQDQYASTVGFTVRSEDISSSADLLSGLAGPLTGGSSSPDTDILYEFMRSSDLVRRVDEKLDLHTLYSRNRGTDPLFTLPPNGTIEDLTEYWQRMVRVAYDSSSKLLELRVLAFDADDAKNIADTVIVESTIMINGLNDISRSDATRYASEDLDIAVERLKSARESITAFRLANQIVDVEADIQGQMGLLNTLQAQQAEALIELDLLSESVRDGDPRLEQAQRRLAVINGRVDEERRKFGAGVVGLGGADYATTISEFERLSVDREFAEVAYATALSSFDAAKAEANRQSQYLAAYAKPTRAEKAEYPQRALLLAGVFLFSFLIWVISSLIYYSLHERR